MGAIRDKLMQELYHRYEKQSDILGMSHNESGTIAHIFTKDEHHRWELKVPPCAHATKCKQSRCSTHDEWEKTIVSVTIQPRV
jgi:hypothetical protein